MADPVATATAPLLRALLRERIAQMDDLNRRLDAVQPGDAAAEERVRALKEQIARQRSVCIQEWELRQAHFDSSRASVADPEPAPDSPVHSGWSEREDARRTVRSRLEKRFKELKAHNPSQYGSSPVASPSLPCLSAAVEKEEAKTINKLVAVEILDGPDDTVLTGRGIQWVNLSAYRMKFQGETLPTWLDAIDGKTVTSYDRLGPKVRVRLRFAQAGRETYFLRLVRKRRGEASYTANELKHGAYQLKPSIDHVTPDWTKGMTEEDGTVIVSLAELTSMGNEQWQFQGADMHGTRVVSGGSLETRRGFFVLPLVMEKVTASEIGPSKGAFADEAVHLEVLPPVRFPYQRFLPRSSNSDVFTATVERFKGKARGAYNVAKLGSDVAADEAAPYLVCCAFYDMSPAQGTAKFSRTFPKLGRVLEIKTTDYNPQYMLWINVDDSEDWLQAVQLVAVHPGGGRSDISVPLGAVTAQGSDEVGYSGIAVDTSQLKISAAPGMVLTLRVTVKVIKGGINGFSSGAQGKGSLIAVCTRHAYRSRSHDEMRQTIIHEFGHKINMVPDGTAAGRGLERVKTQYTERGHTGSHCHTGYAPTSAVEEMTGKPGTCVMFGESGRKRLEHFCAECKERLLKIDLATGWSAF